jgi:DNA-binding GntR family transcriptional regulator
VIYGCSRNQRMATLLVDLQNQVHRVRVLWPSTVARLGDTWSEHAAIVEALRARDGAAAERLMIEHLEKARLSTLHRILPSGGI